MSCFDCAAGRALRQDRLMTLSKSNQDIDGDVFSKYGSEKVYE